MNSLEANIRNNETKGQLNAIRDNGNVPAIIYGGKDENQKIYISKKLLKTLRNFLEIEIFWFWSFPPYIIAGTSPFVLMAFNCPLVELFRMLASSEFIKQSFLTHVYK